MPKTQTSLKVFLSALFLGAVFFAANLYFGANDHTSLATWSFVLAILSELTFTVFAVLWVLGKAWTATAMPMQMPGRPMPGAQMSGAPMAGMQRPGGLVLGPMAGTDQKPQPPQR